MNLFEPFLDLVFPVCCPGCGVKTEKGNPWCAECVPKFWHPRMIDGSAAGHFAGCYTCCQYTEGIRTCLIKLKYGHREDFAEAFPPLLENFPWWDRLADIEIAAPVPLYHERLRARGYNQVDLIFENFLTARGIAYDPALLVRVRPTGKQTERDPEARRKNVRGAFHINRGKEIKGKTVLLVDDIYTTGATMQEAARELRRAGAEKIIGMTVASGAG